MLKALKAAVDATLSRMRHVPDTGAGMMRLMRRTRIDYRKEVGNGLDASVFTAPVQWIARALPEARLTVKRTRRDGVEEDLADHDLVKLVANPNPFYGDMALWMATIVCFCFDGNAYWVKLRNRAGRPVQLWYVPHWMMEPLGSLDGSSFLTHYKYTPGSGLEPIIIAPDDVVHFRHGISPSNPRKGLSPIGGVLREIFMDLEASNFVAALLRNMGVPGVVIAPKAGALPTAEDVEATKVWFKQSFGGDKRGDPLVMGAPTDVHQFGFNPQQMNMDGARDVAEERICAALGVPAAVVGFGAGLQQTKVGATMESLLKLAWHNGVLPYCRMFADELSRSLLPDFGNPAGTRVTHDTSEVMALADHEDRETDRWVKRLGSGGVQVAEAREAWGLPVDDSHRVYLRPIAVLEVPAGAPPRAIAPPKAQGEKARASAQAMERASAYARVVASAEKGQIAKVEGLLKAFFMGLGAAVREAAQPFIDADPTIAKARPADGEKADELLIEQILQALGIPAHETTFRRLLEQHFLEVARTIAEAGELAGLSGRLPDPVARAIVAAGGRRAGLIDISDQTRRALYDALAEGRAAGEGVTQLVARIAGEVEAGPWGSAETRARTIARTETKYAQNISTIERGRAAGVEQFMVIDGRLGPGRSLPSHMARNGSIVSATEAREMADAEHPNGTLSFAPHFGLDDEED
ncbi:portal protein [Maricaulis sp. W15]|uniref:phage portal protein n=1 Tax=Maricaulis sp. W15 TaxID=1772333 RepID=UPI0009491C20|nr:phage portal protein [Maricaulis sp. W15]OLF81265.1 portal protein [Maricaulis sp. W15]